MVFNTFTSTLGECPPLAAATFLFTHFSNALFHFVLFESNELKCKMKFAAYVPKTEGTGDKLTFLIWLSGLTCNEQNFITKSGFHRLAQKHKICVIAPDTSPSSRSFSFEFFKFLDFVHLRFALWYCYFPGGCNIEGETDRWDFGAGAGFYIDATEEKWKNNYRMYSYINSEVWIRIFEKWEFFRSNRSITCVSLIQSFTMWFEKISTTTRETWEWAFSVIVWVATVLCWAFSKIQANTSQCRRLRPFAIRSIVIGESLLSMGIWEPTQRLGKYKLTKILNILNWNFLYFNSFVNMFHSGIWLVLFG